MARGKVTRLQLQREEIALERDRLALQKERGVIESAFETEAMLAKVKVRAKMTFILKQKVHILLSSK